MINTFSKFNVTYSFCRARTAFLLIILVWGTTGCSSFKTLMTQSRFPDRQIVVDGRPGDWTGNLLAVEGKGISLGFLNDQEYLYICLRAENASTRAQVLRSGLTVWFDPKGGKKKTLGIKFPIGIPRQERPVLSGRNAEESELKERLEESLNELEIIRSEYEEPEKMEIAEAKGIEIKALLPRGSLVYELKIPLLRSEQSPIAVGAEPGKTIGVGFETGNFDFNVMPRRPGGMSPMGGRLGRGGLGRVGGRMPQMPEDLKIWATVKIVT